MPRGGGDLTGGLRRAENCHKYVDKTEKETTFERGGGQGLQARKSSRGAVRSISGVAMQELVRGWHETKRKYFKGDT